MHILIHRKTLKDMMNVSKDLQDVLAPVFKETMFVRHKGTVLDIGDVRVDFRCGSKDKLAGLRPDFYNTDSFEASEFLYQSACKCNGKELYTIAHVYDVIVGHFRGLCKEDPVLFIEKFLNITMLEYQKVYVREVFKKLSEKQIKED